MADFMELFLKFRGYVKDGKVFQVHMEEIKCNVEDIDMLQKNHLEVLEKIPEMSLQ